MKFIKFINNFLPKILQNNIGAVSFDGIDDKLQRTSSVISGTVFTIYCRFKLNSAGTQEDICSITNIGSASQYFRFLSLATNSYLVDVRAGGGTPGSSGWARMTWGTTDTNYHTFVLVARSSTDYEIFFDGISVATSSTSATLSGLNRTNLGHWVRSTSSDFGNCNISEFATWNTDLTIDQVKQITGGIKGTVLGIDVPNLTDYNPLDDHSDGQNVDTLTFRDSSGNGNDLTGDDGGNNTGLTSVAEPVMSYQSEIIIPVSEALPDTDESENLQISDSIIVTDTIIQEIENLQITDSILIQDTIIQESENLQISDSIIVTDTNIDAKFISKIISINPLIFITDTDPIEIIKVDITDPENITWIVRTVPGVSSGKDVAVNTQNDFIYIAGNSGQIVKVEIADLNNQTIIDVNDIDDLLTIETNSNFGLTYAGTENEVGELYVIDERETFLIDSDLQVLAPIEFQLESDFNIIATFKVDSDLQVLSEETVQLNTDFKCITKPLVPSPPSVSPLDTIIPINLTDFQVFVDSVELEDTDLILNSIIINHSEAQQSTASFQLSRKHDQLNTTLQGNFVEITNQNNIEVRIKGRTEFTGQVSELDCKYNDDREFIQVNALAEEKINQFNNVTLSLPNLDSRLSLYDILIQNPRIFYGDTSDENSETDIKKFKGIRVNLGTKNTQSITRIKVNDPFGNIASDIQLGTFNPFQNWTYFWGTIKVVNFGNVSLGETAAKEFFYIGTSLTPISEDLWNLNNANHHRQRIYDDLTFKLGNGTVAVSDFDGVVDNPTDVHLQLQNKTFLLGGSGIITNKFKESTDHTELDLNDVTINEQAEVYDIIEKALGFTVGEAPFQDISVRNGILVTKPKLVDETDRLSNIKEAGFNFEEFAKRTAELEFEKLKNINGTILPDTSCTFDLTVDAYFYYDISLLTRINVDNTTETNIYNSQNGFPVSAKSITITSANRQVSIEADNIKSTKELEEIDGDFPNEEDDEYNEKAQRILIAIKSDMRTGFDVE